MPNMGYAGTDSICLIVCDNIGACDSTIVPVLVVEPIVPQPTPAPPVVIPTPIYVPKDSMTSVCTPILDPNIGDTFSATLCPGSPTHGTAITSVMGAELCLDYTPDNGYTGEDVVCVIVCDQTGLCDTVDIPVIVLITPPAPIDSMQAPVVIIPSIVTIEDSTLTVCGAIFDVNPGDTHTATICQMPSNGSVSLSVDNTTDQLCLTFDPLVGFEGTDSVCVVVCDQTGLCDTINVPILVLPRATQLKLKVLLQGAMLGVSDGLMRDDLRQQGFIPLAEPYDSLNSDGQFEPVGGGNEMTNTSVLAANAGTPDAVVDWMFVELRNPLDSTAIVRTIAALVQRDGDVVAAHNGGDLIVTSVPRSFFVSVKHRNHLGTMTASAIPITGEIAVVDFTTKAHADLYHKPGYDTLAVTTVLGKRALWVGNTNKDIRTKYDGATNDKLTANFEVITESGNIQNSLNYNFAAGYYQGDVNMDGKVKYDGAGNDIILIQNIVLTYPLNISFLKNFDYFLEQLP